MPPILARFWPVLSIGIEKTAEKNHGLPDQAKTSIFVTSAPRASFWPSFTKFHFWLFPSLGDSKAKLVLSDCKEKDLLKRNSKKNWPHQKQKFIDNKSDFLACLMISYY